MKNVINTAIIVVIVAAFGLVATGMYQLADNASAEVVDANEVEMPVFSCIQMGDQPKEEAACWRTEDGQRVANYGQLKLTLGAETAARLIATRD